MWRWIRPKRRRMPLSRPSRWPNRWTIQRVMSLRQEAARIPLRWMKIISIPKPKQKITSWPRKRVMSLRQEAARIPLRWMKIISIPKPKQKITSWPRKRAWLHPIIRVPIFTWEPMVITTRLSLFTVMIMCIARLKFMPTGRPRANMLRTNGILGPISWRARKT